MYEDPGKPLEDAQYGCGCREEVGELVDLVFGVSQ
jgi:hypothetical protein